MQDTTEEVKEIFTDMRKGIRVTESGGQVETHIIGRVSLEEMSTYVCDTDIPFDVCATMLKNFQGVKKTKMASVAKLLSD